jgi:hypothetical protein
MGVCGEPDSSHVERRIGITTRIPHYQLARSTTQEAAAITKKKLKDQEQKMKT